MNNRKKIISVIITTHNRYKYLIECLKSLCNQTLAANRFEVIVVDSYSDNKLKNLKIINFYKKKINIKYFYYNKKEGITGSRNFAVLKSQYENIIQVDDDSIVDKNYLINALRSFNRYNADIVVGKMLPLFKIDPDKKLIKKITTNYRNGYYIEDFSVVNLGEKCIRIPYYLACATNMIYKKKFYIESGGFGPDGFSNPYLYLNGSGEHNYTIKAKKIMYVPNMISYHVIEKNRLDFNYFKARSLFYGISRSFYDQNNFLRRAKTLIKIFLTFILSILKFDIFSFKRNISYSKGYLNHQLAMIKSPEFKSFCERSSWINYDFSKVQKINFGTEISQWNLINTK